jgi:hypothetical protein
VAQPREFEFITPERRGILGALDEFGVVTFFIVAGEGSSIRGTELFNRMMQFFGDDVRAIHGMWRKGPLGLPSTNIDKVNELTSAGMPLLEAIRYAWTATRAAKLGFQKMRLLGEPQGATGAYVSVDVLIER